MNMKNPLIAFLLSALFVSGASAHSNHAPKGPIPKELAGVKAEKVVKNLVNQNKLEQSWEVASLIGIAQEDRPQGKVWVIQYVNEAANDQNTKSLYVVMDDMGNTLSATHSEPQ